MALSTEDLLQNWGRWLRAGPRVDGQCGSIEGRWRSARCWYPPQPRPLPSDELDALRVDRVMHLVPRRHRNALRLHYLHRFPVFLVARRVAIGADEIEEFMRRARLVVKNLLTRAEKWATMRAITATAGVRRDTHPRGSSVAPRVTPMPG